MVQRETVRLNLSGKTFAGEGGNGGAGSGGRLQCTSGVTSFWKVTLIAAQGGSGEKDFSDEDDHVTVNFRSIGQKFGEV